MVSLSTPLITRRKEKEPDEQQLLRLFWNRAELKKDLAQLRRDREKLVNQLREHERSGQQARQRLVQLENLLGDPLQAVNVMVYYQLRSVWAQCRQRMAQLARELSQRQQERELQQHVSAFDQDRATDLAGFDGKIAVLETRRSDGQKDLDTLSAQQRQLKGFWNYFRRRSLAEHAEAVHAVIEGIDVQIGRLQAERSEKEREDAPTFQELSTTGKRHINLAIIAMAEQLLVHLSGHDVAARAREAAIRSVTDVSYGSVADCQKLARLINTVVCGLERNENLNALARRRAEYLALKVQYRRQIDTIPVAGSFAGVAVELTTRGEPRPVDERVIAVNVLAEEYWDLNSVLVD